MPYTIKTQQIAVKDPDTGAYVGVDILTEQTTEGLLNEIEVLGNNKKTAVTNEGAAQVTNVQNAGAATVALVNNTVSQSQTAVDNLQQQRDDIVTSVTDTLSKGVDNSLTMPSMPAEAKAVGDLYETIVVDSETQPNKRWNRVWVKPATEEVEVPTMDEFKSLILETNISLNFVSGSITVADGSNGNNSKRIRTDEFISIGTMKYLYYSLPTGYEMLIFMYRNNNISTYIDIANSSWLTGTGYLQLSEECRFVRFVIAYEGRNVDITPEEAPNNLIIKILDSADMTLSVSGKPADAKATGDRVYEKRSDLGYDNWYKYTDGNISFYDLSSCPLSPMSIYDLNNEIIDTVYGTDYIKVHNTDYVFISCAGLFGGAENSIADGDFYIYFYNADKQPIWTVLNYDNETYGVKNRVNSQYLKSLNGFMFYNIPDGYYIRMAAANGYNGRVIIWNGYKFGYPAVTTGNVIFDTDGNKNIFPENGGMNISIPSYVQYVLAKPGYTFLGLINSLESNDNSPVQNLETKYPAQIARCANIAKGTRNKDIIVVKNYNYETGEYEPVQYYGDLSDYIVFMLPNIVEKEQPTGYSQYAVMKNINALLDFTWTAQKDHIYKDGVNMYKKGVTYNGIPYRSNWTQPHFVGWHVTKHTFLNAANDPDSIFYNTANESSTPGLYYSLVCSSFATLVCGFDRPITNIAMMHDPHVSVYRGAEMPLCEVVTNGVGHCIIPIQRNSAKNYPERFAVTIAEEAGSVRKRNVYNDVPSYWDGLGEVTNFLNAYQYAVLPERRTSPPYDITQGSIINGSARPYVGDRGVYTSLMPVKINIKDENANRLYYQKFTCSVNYGVASNFQVDGDPSFIDITPGVTQVILRSATENGSFTGADLVDGGIYGVWISVDESQTVAPDNIEYFEWYDVTTSPITYTINDGVFVSDSEFWYACVNGRNYKDVISTNGGATMAFSLKYQPPGKDIYGHNNTHCDYSNHRECVYITSVNSFFKKGRFGAYNVGKVVDTGTPDDD